jgi:hypothetical protein
VDYDPLYIIIRGGVSCIIIFIDENCSVTYKNATG